MLKMKKLIPMLLLVGVSTNVFAEWTEVGGNDGMNTYVDFATIRKHGDLVKMWQLYDFKKIRQQKDSSIYPQKIKLNTTVKKSKRGLRLTHGSLAIWVMGMLFILALNTVNGIPFNLEVLAKRFLKSPAA